MEPNQMLPTVDVEALLTVYLNTPIKEYVLITLLALLAEAAERGDPPPFDVRPQRIKNLPTK
jgi:hypothetical protein